MKNSVVVNMVCEQYGIDKRDLNLEFQYSSSEGMTFEAINWVNSTKTTRIITIKVETSIIEYGEII